jgi:hypothetical protein
VLRSVDVRTPPGRFSEETLIKFRATFTREEIAQNGLSDDDLARFLIARNGNIEKSRALLLEHLVWRKSKLPIFKSSCLTEFAKGKIYMHGFDREGHPLVIYRSKLQIPAERDLDEMLNLCYWWAEKVVASLPDDKSKATILIDRTDAGMQNSDMDFIRAMASVFQNNYPERLFRAVVYPSGIVFYTIWNLIKWFLDPVTQHKVQPVLTVAGVTEFIEPMYVPRYMGGECDFTFSADDEDWAEPTPPSAEPAASASESASASEKPSCTFSVRSFLCLVGPKR